MLENDSGMAAVFIVIVHIMCRKRCGFHMSVMQGCCNDVAVQILQVQPRVLHTHCYGHSLNLACQDVIIKPIEKSPDTAFELSKLLKYS